MIAKSDQPRRNALALTDADLDRKIRASLTAVDVAMAETVAEAWKAGVLLLTRKARVEHGAWLPYLETIGLAPRSAQQYMRLAANTNPDTHLETTVRGSLDAMKTLPAPHPRLGEMFDAYPGLAMQWGDPDVCEVVDRYLDISDRLFGWSAGPRAAEAPSQAEFSWCVGVERLMAREFGTNG